MNAILLQAPIMAAALLMIIIALLVSVLIIVAQWFVYTKAGQPGWAVLIPFYNMIVLLKIVGRPASWIFLFLQVILFDILFLIDQGVITGLLLGLSGITALVFSIIVTNDLSKIFGKDAGFTVGLIFLPYIFIPFWDSERPHILAREAPLLL